MRDQDSAKIQPRDISQIPHQYFPSKHQTSKTSLKNCPIPEEPKEKNTSKLDLVSRDTKDAGKKEEHLRQYPPHWEIN